MAILVVQSASGTTQLHGSAPDPTNVPGNNWYSDLTPNFVRKSGGGVLIPDSPNSGILSYDTETARHKISFTNVVLNGNYIRFKINMAAQGSTPFVSGSGYTFYVAPGTGAFIEKWTGGGAPSSFGSTSSNLPSAPITITSVYLEHLSSGTINARAVIGGTNYDSTLSDGSPLTGTFAGMFVSNSFATGIPADSITIEDDAAATPNPPTGVTAGSITAFSVTASWTDASSDETGFKVQYAPSPYSSWTAFSGSPAAANATTLASGTVLTPGTSYKIRVASTNANGDSAFVESGVFTTTPLTFLRPIADTSNGAWTASSGSDRYAMIDESATYDADYITVSSASTYKARLTTVSDPGVDTDHSVVVRAKGDGSSQLTIALVQGDPTETAIASTTVTPTTSYADYTLTVTSGQAANITDYSLLYLKLTSL